MTLPSPPSMKTNFKVGPDPVVEIRLEIEPPDPPSPQVWIVWTTTTLRDGRGTRPGRARYYAREARDIERPRQETAEEAVRNGAILFAAQGAPLQG